jgi:hypothetical protein
VLRVFETHRASDARPKVQKVQFWQKVQKVQLWQFVQFWQLWQKVQFLQKWGALALHPRAH